MQFSGDQRRTLLDAARHVIRAALRDDAVKSAATSPASNVDSDLLTPAGCFVSLHEMQTHRLRGCVGRIEAKAPLIEAARDAAAAVLRDPRFTDHRITTDELSKLSIELTVLSALSPTSDTLDFDPIEHGIHLVIEGRSACFLPQVARETGWSREQLLARLCTEKLHMSPDAWQRPEARLSTFTAEIIGPEPFE